MQFGGERALTLRVVAVLDDRPTFDGWIWLAGYVLDAKGLATDRRELFVQFAGLHPLTAVVVPAHCRHSGAAVRSAP
ncbi:hypothetical protein ACIBJE_16115 [Micromonospora sp. NPDC050187]|uniref:hypothetical protein n=1 Tax=Micromonospora sp. NPDC050187 TaxID=3364277 RepID=UPI00379571C0